MKKPDSLSRLVLLVIVLVMPSLVFAHTGVDLHTGWLHGFIHPLSGLDHVLAMIAVGLWAAQSSRVVWLIPLFFVAIMGLGGLLGIVTLPLVFAEYGILLSLVVLGMLIACRKHLPLTVSIVLVGLFALSHGYAHGSEMPHDISIVSYVAGFMLATLLLHLSGIGLALTARHFESTSWPRFGGIMIACYGGFLLIH